MRYERALAAFLNSIPVESRDEEAVRLFDRTLCAQSARLVDTVAALFRQVFRL